jgi:methylglutaconyl-CoA hydratase
MRLGLVDKIVTETELETAGQSMAEKVLENGPSAVAAAKRLINRVKDQPIDAQLVEETAKLNAEMRATDEGREGIASFLEKRTPAWRKS